MSSDGTPIIIMGDTSNSLIREKIGGKDGSHDEQWLQRLLHRHPTCIPMDQIEPGIPTLVPICMELPLLSGFLDNLLMSPDGDIVIVEAKLWRNPEARREVVAQALDYATSLFGMDYATFESAVLKADFDGAEKPTRLYDLFNAPDTLDEPDFVDAVTTNLRNGRIVVLVIGDGIRTGTEILVEGLKSHAMFHFTFALVELGVFRSPRENDLIAIPRTLIKTFMVERGIVRINDERTETVAIQQQRGGTIPQTPLSITSEQFYEAMKTRHPNLPAKLKAFVDRLTTLGVYAEYKRSLNLKWDPPAGKTINFGYVQRNGQLWTESAGLSLSDPNLARAYNADLASRLGGEVKLFGKQETPYVAVNGSAPRIEDLMDKFDDWYAAIDRFQNRVTEHIMENDGEE